MRTNERERKQSSGINLEECGETLIEKMPTSSAPERSILPQTKSRDDGVCER
jgi:hypothetical protein